MKAPSLSPYLFLFLIGLLAGCNEQPAPATTAIQGQVRLGVQVVALSSTTTPVSTALRVPAGNGTYRFDSLAAGTYTLSFMPVISYGTPAAQTVHAVAGTTSTVALVAPSGGQYLFGSQGIADYHVDADDIPFDTILTRQTGNTLQLTLEPQAGPEGKQLSIVLTGFTSRVSTFYSTNPTINAKLVYREYTNSNTSTWSTTPGVTSSVVVTNVVASSRRMSGTFTAVVAPTLNATNNRTIVGYFSQVPY